MDTEKILVEKLRKLRGGSKLLSDTVSTLNADEIKLIVTAGSDFQTAINNENYNRIYLADIYYMVVNVDEDKQLLCLNSLIEKGKDCEIFLNNRGIIWSKKIELSKAIDDYTKSIEINSKYASSYNNRGYTFQLNEEYDKSIIDYSKAIELDIEFPLVFINRANAYLAINEQDKALSDYEKYLSFPESEKDQYYVQFAKDKIEEINKSILKPSFKYISDTIESIKRILLYEENCITHYTGLSVAKILILDNNSLFRLSEGAFLNDTSEGRELFEFLDIQFTAKTSEKTEGELFAKKPFIGSFVAESKHNNLTLWRMYGKEGKEEAKGCAITIDRNTFVDSIREKLIPHDATKLKINDDFLFYRVAYKDHEQKDTFIIPGAKKKSELELNRLMSMLSVYVEEYKKDNEQDITVKKNLEEKLNEIAYLFKSVEYQHENELRLVLKGIGFEKIVDNSFPTPRVYIELVNVRSSIKKITLGPKVEKADEWSSAFYYNLEKDSFEPQIFISHLPFK